MRHKVSVVIPAYNEEKNISVITNILLSSKYVDEVVCVNDGSTDKTLDLLKKIKGIILLTNKKNRGKAFAVSRGVKKAKGEIVLLIDADLVGLKDLHIKRMIEPLLNNRCEVVIGYLYHYAVDKFTKPIAGERAYFKKSLLPYLKEFKDKGYALELYLNYLFKDKKVKLFPLRGVNHIYRRKKHAQKIAARLTLAAFLDIGTEIIRHKNPIYFVFSAYLKNYYF